ncbi:hypothetical protein Zm00014a_008579 [Zea mays]|uniref:DUF1618 domain-containing protein n=2 Tax=Zea mays TaxID=4577 RepID=B6TLP1_MAIZE|nr:uncharacterized protein LOC100276956 [Zea mays]ACG38024.1 hypothetical protein [Zea mays]ACR38742.1 unknown [Zea mays]AQK56158.1 hypothetical protein ZEAMMB73_Zm00001d052089 [Zea mays]PWZ28909.1 hypothetical protein Zm00014a_008579 [Zea mays]|eukprot:NP_001144116.1 uncharacterized protein LOC100276956 [Zea mays]
MSGTSSFTTGESSRAGEQPERDEVVEFKARTWVALSSIIVVHSANDEGRRMLALRASDIFLDLQPPQVGASYLVLPDRIVKHPRYADHPVVLSACSDHFLFRATPAEGPSNLICFFVGDVNARTVVRLPEVPFHMAVNTIPHPQYSIGLIADPRSRHGGHYMVAQLHPTFTTHHTTLLCYSSVTDQWTARPLASTESEEHHRWGAHGVLAHGGLLWWIDLFYGMLVCDPFAADDNLHLRFVPLPVGSIRTGRRVPGPENIGRERFIRPSQGKLRYVEIQGAPSGMRTSNYQPPSNPQVRMFTLVSQEGQHHWVHEYTATFLDIWSHRSYAEAGLPQGVVPWLALIDPNNANTLYFFRGTTLFAVDGQTRQVLFRVRCLVLESARGGHRFQNSRFIGAWELPPALEPDVLCTHDVGGGSSIWGSDSEGTDGSDREQAISDQATNSGDQAADSPDQAADSPDQADAEP